MKYLMVKTQTGNLTLEPMILFSAFKFQICLPWSFTTKMIILHIQCLLRVGGSILAGVSNRSTYHQTVAVMCLTTQYFVVTVYRDFFGEPNHSPHEVSGGFISPKPPYR